MEKLVSAATTRNWKRLKSDRNGKLTSRANKTLSEKTFIPREYISHYENLPKITDLILFLKELPYEIGDIMYSLGINLLKENGLYAKKHVKKVLEEFQFKEIPVIVNLGLEIYNEIDLLGLIYQSLITEGKKNKNGSYYTPHQIVRDMTKDLDFSDNKLLLDPCCGTGAFFLTLENVQPQQIFGIERSYIPYMLAKINLLLKFDSFCFSPQIFHFDFFELMENIASNEIFRNQKFNYIITNPPWGSIVLDKYLHPLLHSKESSSLFFVNSFDLLQEKGIIRFLFPESVLNVKVHADLRRFMLNHGNLKSITVYDNLFSGVTTSFVDIELVKEEREKKVQFTIKNKKIMVEKSAFQETENNTFCPIESTDLKLIKKMKKAGKYSLKNSVWALGIVTGDNKRKLKESPFKGGEVIYTGKEILPFRLQQSKKYINYDKSKLQQVAKDEIYRADEKLVYKFISKQLVFAYDDSKSLFLNSANILIPSIPNMSIKTVLGFLNSKAFQYFYKQLFGEIKILKGNLMEFPFPEISKKLDDEITELVSAIILGEDEKKELLEKKIYEAFSLNQEEQKVIERSV